MLPNASLASIVDEEVSLDGLEGSTLDALSHHIAQRLRMSVPMPRRVTDSLWLLIVRNAEFGFYLLPTERKPHIHFDRFALVDPDTGIPQQPDEYPGHRFRYNLIEQDGVRGSCEEFDTRSAIPREELLAVGWNEAENRYGRKFVVVASQRLRESFLIPPNCTHELTGIQYCMLEWIGRARFNGETSQGRFSLLDVTRESSTLFYNRKALCSARLITRQSLCMRTKEAGSVQGMVFHLPRYYREMKPKQLLIVERVVCELRKRKHYMADYEEIKHLVLGKAEAKKVFRTPEFLRYVRIDEMVPYRTLYPDAPSTMWKSKRGDEKSVRVMRLIDPAADVFELWSREAQDDEVRDGFLCRSDSSALYVDVPMLRLAYETIAKSGKKGLSQSELGFALGLDRLNARCIVRNLTKLKAIESQSVNQGRQRTAKFFISGHLPMSNTLEKELSQFVSNQLNVIETQRQREQVPSGNDQPQPSTSADGTLLTPNNNLLADAQELPDLKFPQEEYPFDVSQQKAIVSEVTFSNKLQLKKPTKGITSSFRSINERLLGRCNFILELVKREYAMEPRKIVNRLNEYELDDGYLHRACSKSIMRLIARLVDDRLLVIANVTIRGVGTREHHQMLVCDPSVTSNHPAMQHKLGQLKADFALRTNREESTASEAQSAAKANRDPPRPSTTRVRGYPNCLAKCLRMKLFHEYIFYLAYIHSPDARELTPSELTEVDLSDLEPDERLPVYSNTNDWKMFVKPLSTYDTYGSATGWILLMDITARMPMWIFCSICTYAFYTKELDYYLDHPIRRYLPVKHLPDAIRTQILSSRRHARLIFEITKLLCWAGLVQIGPRVLKARDQTFVYVRRTAAFLDTSPSCAGYIEIEDRSYEQLTFHFATLADVQEYWSRLYEVTSHTRLNMRSTAFGRELLVQKVFAKPAMQAAIAACTMGSALANDRGQLPPGDRRGAAGMDSGMFMHLHSNWHKSINLGLPLDKHRLKVVRKAIRTKPFGGGGGAVVASGSKTTDKRLTLRKGGRTIGGGVPLVPIVKPTGRRRQITRRVLKPCHRRSARERYDEIDLRALKQMNKLRVKWSRSEDQLLMICRVALMYMYSPAVRSVPTVKSTTLRDILHWSSARSHNKTSHACTRRLNYMTRKLPGVAEQLRMQVEESKLNPLVAGRFGAGFVAKLRQYFPRADDHVLAVRIHFVQLVALLRSTLSKSCTSDDHFQLAPVRGAEQQSQPGKKHRTATESEKKSSRFRLPRTIGELCRRYDIIETSHGAGKKLSYAKDPSSTDELQLYKFTIVLHSAIANGRAKSDDRLLYIYSQYPENVLMRAMSMLRSMQLVSVTKWVKASSNAVLGNLMARQDKLCHVSISYQQHLMTAIPLEAFVPLFDLYVRLLERDAPYTLEDGTDDGLVLLLGELMATEGDDGQRRIELRIDPAANYIEMNPDAKGRSDTGEEGSQALPTLYAEMLPPAPVATAKQKQRTTSPSRRSEKRSQGKKVTPSPVSVATATAQLRFVAKADVMFHYVVHPAERLLKLPLEYFHFFCLLEQLRSAGRRLLAQTFKIDEQRTGQCSLPNCLIVGGGDLVERCLTLARDREDQLERIRRHDGERAKLAPRSNRTDPALLFDVREDNLLLFFGRYITDFQQRYGARHKRDVNRHQQVLASLTRHTVNMADLVGECLRFDRESPDYRWLDRIAVSGNRAGDYDDGDDDGGEEIDPEAATSGASEALSAGTAMDDESGARGMSGVSGRKAGSKRIGMLSALSEKVYKLHNFYEVSSKKMHIHVHWPPGADVAERESYGQSSVPRWFLPGGAKRRQQILFALESEALWPPADMVEPLMADATGLIAQNRQACALLSFIESKRNLGATIGELANVFANDDHHELGQHLGRLRNLKLVLRAGFRSITYIHWRFVDEWLVKSFVGIGDSDEPTAPQAATRAPATEEASTSQTKGQRKRKHNQETTSNKKRKQMPSENQNEECKVKDEASQTVPKPKQTVLVVMAPWIQLNGMINNRLLYRWLTSILLYCVAHTGIPLSALFQRFNMMAPFHVRQLLELLQEYGCVTLQALRCQAKKASLFSSFKPATLVPATEFTSDDHLFVETTANALSTLALCIGEYRKYAQDIFVDAETRKKRRRHSIEEAEGAA
ncbi:general transcription factor 3C polypeptide 1 [Anopheles cruzii]|uniref:general transcription factor 3C polypeptide 1 n=1 Tax=Anopheles cruzii TaxID=68878 RepID=UPI0022EC3899|nr:general transcription factor 3C polypeptide 1 [Anopheles cruzii]